MTHIETIPGSTNSPGLDVLVVEDNQDTADSLATILQLQGHLVRVECNGLDAVAAAKERLPDVAIIDIGLPGLNGLAVASELRKLSKEKRPLIVAVSGFSQEQASRFGEPDVDLYLVKPTEPAVLSGVLKRFQRTLA